MDGAQKCLDRFVMHRFSKVGSLELISWLDAQNRGLRSKFSPKFVSQELKFGPNWALKCIFSPKYKYGLCLFGAEKWFEMVTPIER